MKVTLGVSAEGKQVTIPSTPTPLLIIEGPIKLAYNYFTQQIMSSLDSFKLVCLGSSQCQHTQEHFQELTADIMSFEMPGVFIVEEVSGKFRACVDAPGTKVSAQILFTQWGGKRYKLLSGVYGTLR